MTLNFATDLQYKALTSPSKISFYGQNEMMFPITILLVDDVIRLPVFWPLLGSNKYSMPILYNKQ